MEIKSKDIELVNINKLIPYEKNMNKHSDEQIDRLVDIIKYQGWRQPVIAQAGTNIIAAGHGRYMAAKKMGLSQVPVMYQEFKSEEEFYAFVVSDNAIASWAELDLSAINQEMLDLGPDFDIDLLGIKDFVIEPVEKFEPQSDEDAVPEVKHDPITKRGDVWLLGSHRVMCGDSTMIDDVERLMNDERADMVYTDPPYGMKLDTNYSGMKGWHQGKEYKKIKGDHNDFSDELINAIFYFDYVKEMFIWGADYFAQLLPGRNDGSWIVWDKRVDESKDSMYGSCFELCWSKNKHKRIFERRMWAGFMGDAEASKRQHPTQKPSAIAVSFFERWCDNLNLCVDLYLGSGSTLIACEKTNRKCYGMELDEHYCDVIIKRWQDYTGKEAILESTKQTYNSMVKHG